MRALAPIAVAVLAVVTPASALAARTYEVPGAKAVAVKSLDATTSLVAPTSGGPYPLVVASHGFSASGDNQIGWARHFASWGFVVAVPSFPSPLAPDTAKNAAVIEGLVTKLQGPLAATEGVASGPFGLEGHSAGGLATTVAAMKLTPAATVLFDPVDRNSEGKTAYAKICAPVMAIFAGPSSCNNNAEWRAFAKSAVGDLVAFDVKGSTHCDGENGARALCGTFCGGAASAPRQGIYAHYATAFLLARLTNDAAATSALAAAVVDADADLDAVMHGTASCSAPSPDAGTSADAGTSTPADGGATAGPVAPSPAAAGGEGEGSTAPPDTGCGCRTTPGPVSSASGLALALAALLVARRRR
jgi:MYXO-CTERM domain-containing protein